METIETTNSKKIDWYEVVDNTVKETTTDYFTEIYDPGSTKQQLEIWIEVAKQKSVSWTIDTTDSTIETTSNTYTLSVANPDWEIFSLWVDWEEKTFKIWYYWNTTLAYAELETELISWLTAYDVEYDSWTNFNLARIDWQAITITHPNLSRTIQLTWYNSLAKIDVIVDWVTVQLLGSSYATASLAITYLKSQLSSSLYFMTDDNDTLIIARKDWAIPSISKTQYNIYSYSINYSYNDTPNTGQYWNYTNTTIDSNVFYTYGSQWRPFYWDRIVRNLWWWTETATDTYDTTETTTDQVWRNITPVIDWKLTTVLKETSCTATRCILKQWATTLATTTFSWNTATFDYVLTKWTTYSILADNNWASYTQRRKDIWAEVINEFFTLVWWNPSSSHNIVTVNVAFVTPTWYITSTKFNKSSWWYDTTWNSLNTAQYFNQVHNLLINKSDYSSITASSLNHYTDPWTFADDSAWYSLTTTNNLADITIATQTEITITLTLLSNTYFIPVPLKIKKIVMNAVSSWWSSEWIYELREQSCTTSWVTVVADKIFKTDSTNYWNIVLIKKAWFIINWTTDKKNILTYTCT